MKLSFLLDKGLEGFKMYCPYCGKEISDSAAICLNCGCAVPGTSTQKKSVGSHSAGESHLSLILGIVGIVAAWIFALAGHAASIIGIIYGIKEKNATGSSIGLIVSIIGEVCSVISSASGIIAAFSLFF